MFLPCHHFGLAGLVGEEKKNNSSRFIHLLLGNSAVSKTVKQILLSESGAWISGPSKPRRASRDCRPRPPAAARSEEATFHTANSHVH